MYFLSHDCWEYSRKARIGIIELNSYHEIYRSFFHCYIGNTSNANELMIDALTKYFDAAKLNQDADAKTLTSNIKKFLIGKSHLTHLTPTEMIKYVNFLASFNRPDYSQWYSDLLTHVAFICLQKKFLDNKVADDLTPMIFLLAAIKIQPLHVTAKYHLKGLSHYFQTKIAEVLEIESKSKPLEKTASIFGSYTPFIKNVPERELF